MVASGAGADGVADSTGVQFEESANGFRFSVWGFGEPLFRELGMNGPHAGRQHASVKAARNGEIAFVLRASPERSSVARRGLES